MIAAMIKSAIILAAAAFVASLMKRQSAAFRHAVWTAGLIGAMAIPLFDYAAFLADKPGRAGSCNAPVVNRVLSESFVSSLLDCGSLEQLQEFCFCCIALAGLPG